MYYNQYKVMETNNNSLFLNEKTREILTKIESITHKHGNIFLVNLWKNYIYNPVKQNFLYMYSGMCRYHV